METIIKAKISTGNQKFNVAINKENESLIVNATKRPEKNKVNTEIIKELTKKLKADIEIVSGFKNKEKVLKISLGKEELFNRILTQTNSKKP